jgi:hypothetical protein
MLNLLARPRDELSEFVADNHCISPTLASASLRTFWPDAPGARNRTSERQRRCGVELSRVGRLLMLLEQLELLKSGWCATTSPCAKYLIRGERTTRSRPRCRKTCPWIKCVSRLNRRVTTFDWRSLRVWPPVSAFIYLALLASFFTDSQRVLLRRSAISSLACPPGLPGPLLRQAEGFGSFRSSCGAANRDKPRSR